jgi:rSAM/selenodomain-associated transferase 1
MTGALIVFARQPGAGDVKTRLAAKIGDVRAAGIYARLLSRTLRLAEASRFSDRYLFTADRHQIKFFEDSLASGRWQVCAQCAGNIGKRMHQAMDWGLRRHDFIVLIGSDVADGEVTDLDEAWETLSHLSTNAVIGPSVDGGYWLIGLRESQPTIFNNIAWSTPEVLTATVNRLGTIGIEVKCLTPRHDIDEVEDLQYFA